jgi:general secretion pathway protein E
MTGYLGRVGLYEIMLLTPALRRLVGESAEHALLREQAYRDGMKPLRTSGAIKVASGQTTVDEVLRAAPLA